ncbi:MAG: multi-sensor signal transduction histidine kinase [Verrucomicrobiales bacterium]|nr:multi-sensor signal transduction histidine kinase [Verrucomicrobiales bacterium]
MSTTATLSREELLSEMEVLRARLDEAQEMVRAMRREKSGASPAPVSDAAPVQESLRQSEEFSRTIVESSQDCFKTLTLDGKLLWINKAGRETLHITGLADVLGKSWTEFWNGEDRMNAKRAVAIAATGGVGKFVGCLEIQGEPRWWNVVITPILDAQGHPEKLLAVSRDVTERKRAADALHQRTQQFETLLNEAPLGVYLVDSEFRIRQVNPVALPVFGNIPDLLGRDFNEVIHTLWPRDYADEVILRFRHTLETGEPYIVPERIEQRADRKVREYYHWQISRIALPDGGFGVVCYFQDISESVLVREALRESVERYRTLFNSIDEGFCVIEVLFDTNNKPYDYCFLEINPAFEKQTGLQNAVGKRIRELAPGHEEHWFQIYGKIALTGESRRFENRADAIHRWFDVCAFRVGAPEDRKVAVLFTDISPRKKTEQALAAVKEELDVHAKHLEGVVQERTASLQETNKQLEAFTYTISHDLRAPLRAQQGFASALLADYGDVIGETGRDYAERIIAAATRLDTLVSDLLTYSRINRTEMTIGPVQLRKMVCDICDEMAFEIRETKARVHLHEFFFSVCAHEITLRTTVSNLISNALKFRKLNSSPQIEIGAEERGDWIRLWVQDNGIGIAPEHHHQIFGVFHRLHKTGAYPGTGVGLAIVQKSVERMGGRVGVESQEGTGSRFWIELENADSKRSLGEKRVAQTNARA